MSVRPTSSSTRSAFAVVLSSVWLPCDGRDAEQLDLGAREREQERDRVVVPGIAVEDDRRRHALQYLVDLGGGRQRRLRAEARGGERAGGAGAAQRLLRLAPLEQRDEEAGGEGVAGGRAVDRVDGRRLGAGDLLPVLEQHRALGAERDRDEAVAAPQRLELVAVDDREVGRRASIGARRRRVEAEEPCRLLARRAATASSGISSWQSTASARRQLERPSARAFAPGATTISFSPLASTRISATPVGASTRAAGERRRRSSCGSASSAKRPCRPRRRA